MVGVFQCNISAGRRLALDSIKASVGSGERIEN